MNGAIARVRRERGLVWQGAFLPQQKNPPTYDEFVGGAPRKAEPASFLDMRLRASVKGLRGISMAEALSSMGSK
ncbi:hypothetical protein PZ897_02050 [Hoeflea sp. YIM 152468]|uniref:hypothetical protein n=1 Tax=Hoeflea sp. YIM 152468 TaxID=3031759 RepID=UPI0023DC1B51|nr:hypothetical protein [Hoeflea sp. YIM 152468]MDF1606953.1 hypothetical protein [Hoeflea sp. YIM 152468]